MHSLRATFIVVKHRLSFVERPQNSQIDAPHSTVIYRKVINGFYFLGDSVLTQERSCSLIFSFHDHLNSWSFTFRLRVHCNMSRLLCLIHNTLITLHCYSRSFLLNYGNVLSSVNRCGYPCRLSSNLLVVKQSDCTAND